VKEHTPSTPREAESVNPVVTAGAWEIIPWPNTDDIAPLDDLPTYDIELTDFWDEARDALDEAVFAHDTGNWLAAEAMFTLAIDRLERIEEIVSRDLLPKARELQFFAQGRHSRRDPSKGR
jgi:hypothetical protein